MKASKGFDLFLAEVIEMGGTTETAGRLYGIGLQAVATTGGATGPWELLEALRALRRTIPSAEEDARECS